MLERVRSLPLSADGAIEDIVAACDSPTTTMPAIAERVGHEPALAAIIMRQANSAYYGFGRRIETLPDACVLLGIGTLRTLALTNAALRFLAIDNDGLTPIRRGLLEHSVTVASAARCLAPKAGEQVDRAFLTGLIHELGTIVLSRVAKPEFLHVHVTARRERCAFATVEREVLGFDAAALGARLAEQWRFPDPICEAILHQDEPAGAGPLAAVVHVASWAAAELGRGLVPFDHPRWPDERAAATVGLDPAGLDELFAEIEQGADAWSAAAA
jgi:HD-like signal output (HDOD) protein